MVDLMSFLPTLVSILLFLLTYRNPSVRQAGISSTKALPDVTADGFMEVMRVNSLS